MTGKGDFCMNDVPLCSLAVGEIGRVSALTAMGSMRRRLQDLGVTAGALVICLGHAPSGDPAAYRIGGAVIAIRRADAADVRVVPLGCERP